MGTHFSKRGGHHSGVMTGHEVMAYTFMSGTQCQPKRRKFASSKKYSQSSLTVGCQVGKTVAVKALSRSPSPVSLRMRKVQALENSGLDILGPGRMEILGRRSDRLDAFSRGPDKLDRGSDLDYNSDNRSEQPASNIEIDISSMESNSEMESDSGISVNLSHFDPELTNRSRQDQGVTVAQIINERASPPRLSLPPPPPPPVGLSFAIREQFEEEFCDWYEPGKGKKKTHSRRKSSTRSLHQKLVVSKNNVKKATKIDMDDRAKMLQYFSKSNDDSKNISIHDLFKFSWRVPMAGPRIPSVVTVQAPAGIGKSSMLKYMCLKWSEKELWADNFDILIFIECRTLNHLGSMTCREFISKHVENVSSKIDPEINIVDEIESHASKGRLLFLLDGLDEITGVASLSNLNPKYNPDDILSPLELTQALLCGRLAPGSHIIVTSRPHTLTYLQSSKWFNTLNKRSLALDIQGLSEEGVCAFIHSFVENKISTDDSEDVECTELCPCRTLQNRARADRYIFSLASNPFYLWLICTIFYEAGEGYVPTTLTQLYTWVMLVFSNQWQHTEGKLNLDEDTVHFLKGFAQLCYNLVQTGSIKKTAVLDNAREKLIFPELKLTLDLARAQTFGMMVVSQQDEEVECEFRHLSLAEYLSALHVHTTGEPLKGFAKDRKELILQYLSGLASPSQGKDQLVVENFLLCMGTHVGRRDPLFYLNIIQKMRGEWYNQEGLQKQMLFMRCAYESQVEHLTIFPFPGLKIINIRGNALLTLDLIIINHFVCRLQSDNQLLELSLRDQVLEPSGLRSLLPCLHLIRTVRLNGSQFDSNSIRKLIDVASEVRANLRELYIHELNKKIEPEEVAPLKNMCKMKGIKTNL